MNPLDLLFGQVANAVQQHADPNTPGPGYDANPVLNALSGMFGQYAQQNGQQFSGHQQGQQYENNGPGIGGLLGGLFGGSGGQQQQGGNGNVLDASQDPYGDPADQNDNNESYNPNAGPFGNVRPASEDPYGDPADQR